MELLIKLGGSMKSVSSVAKCPISSAPVSNARFTSEIELLDSSIKTVKWVLQSMCDTTQNYLCKEGIGDINKIFEMCSELGSFIAERVHVELKE